MAKHVVSTLAAAVGLLSAVGGVANAQEKMTIGVSYQNLAFPYVAALQKAAENACKALGAVHRGGRGQRHQQGAQQRREHAVQRHQLPGLRGGEPRSLGRLDQGGEQEGRAGRAVQRQGGRGRLRHLRRIRADRFRRQARPIPRGLYKKLGKDKLRGVYLRGVAGQVTDIARNDGLKNYLNSAGLGDKIEFVEQYADYDRGKGQAVTESILTKDKNYDFIVANNDDMILGALQAANQFGLKIPMAGVDGLPEALAAIKKGDLAATVFQDPEGQGGGGVWGCYLAVKGVKLPKDLLIPFTLVTPDNVDNFVAIADRVYVK